MHYIEGDELIIDLEKYFNFKGLLHRNYGELAGYRLSRCKLTRFHCGEILSQEEFLALIKEG